MDILPGSEQQLLLDIITNIGTLLKTRSASPELAQEFVRLQEECNKSCTHIIIASRNGAYSISLSALELFQDHKYIIHPALQVLKSLISGIPDLLDQRGIGLMLQYLDTQPDMEIQQLVLKWAVQCCMKHQVNREDLFRSNIVDRLKKLLNAETTLAPVIRCVCKLLCALVLDDDAPIDGNSHVNAKAIAIETLCIITTLLKKFKGDIDTLHELLLTLNVLANRNEFCIKVEEAGGVTSILDVMVNFPDNAKLNHRCLQLLKVLIGSDEVKSKIVQMGAVPPLVISAMKRHKSSAKVSAAAAMTVAALALRSAENSRELCKAGAANAIIEVMKAHPNIVIVQKQCCWAVRNIVSRERSLCSQFLALGIEQLIKEVIMTHGKKCDYDAKAALRDLGCSP